MPEDRPQLAFKDKQKYVVKLNIPNAVYPTQLIDVRIPQRSSTFNLDIESTDKAFCIVNSTDRALVKKGASAWFKQNWYNQQRR